MRLLFADPQAHALCADAARAAAYWGAGWTAVAFCLSLLMDSLNLADLRRWASVDVRVADGLLRVAHRDAVFTVVPLFNGGTVFALDEEDAVEHLSKIRNLQIVDVACNGKHAAVHQPR